MCKDRGWQGMAHRPDLAAKFFLSGLPSPADCKEHPEAQHAFGHVEELQQWPEPF